MDLWKSIDKSQLAASAVLVALGAFVVWEAWDWPYLTKDGPGPGFFPLWIGIALIGLSGALIVTQVMDVARGAAEKTKWSGSASAFAGWAALMVAAALLEPLGFVVTLLLLVVFIVVAIFRRSVAAALTVGVGSALGFWVIFVKLLRVQLPAGPWGF